MHICNKTKVFSLSLALSIVFNDSWAMSHRMVISLAIFHVIDFCLDTFIVCEFVCPGCQHIICERGLFFYFCFIRNHVLISLVKSLSIVRSYSIYCTFHFSVHSWAKGNSIGIGIIENVRFAIHFYTDRPHSMLIHCDVTFEKCLLKVRSILGVIITKSCATICGKVCFAQVMSLVCCRHV